MNVKQVLGFVGLMMMVHCTNAQNIKQFVKENTAKINTVESTEDDSDLEPIANAIGDAQVVFLGEQDHGDAPAFLAKTRLIKYLHEKKGFTVLAFESDFYALNEGWKNLHKSKGTIDTFLKKNIFPIWTFCDACGDLLYNYIPSTFTTGKPLNVTGFDNQMILRYSRNHLIKDLDSVLKAWQLPITKQANYTTEILSTIDSLPDAYGDGTHVIQYDRCESFLTSIKQQALENHKPEEFWMMVIENLLKENLSYQKSKAVINKTRNIRDKQMAANISWLLRYQYPGEKIIVWAANGHIAKYGDVQHDDDGTQLVCMGSYFATDTLFAGKTYTIGFTSYQGRAGRLGYKDNFTIPEPRKNGFERWIDPAFEYSFTNFKAYQKPVGKPEKFFMKGFGHMSFTTDWTSIYDGVFFIRNMYPCKMNNELLQH